MGASRQVGLDVLPRTYAHQWLPTAVAGVGFYVMLRLIYFVYRFSSMEINYDLLSSCIVSARTSQAEALPILDPYDMLLVLKTC